MSSLPLVLVVDDDPAMRLLIVEALHQAGFTVEEAEDGMPALAAFERLQPDLVMLDVNMPEMDGFAVCAALRKLPAGGATPVLMVTGLDDLTSINRAYEVGATDFISKPINWAVLGHRVRYILRASQAFEELRQNQRSLAEAQRIAGLGNWVWDIEKNRARWHGIVYEGFDMPSESSDATFQAFVRWVHPEDRERIRTAFEAAVTGIAPLNVEHRVLGPDGQVRFVHQRGEVTFDQNGKAVRLAGTTQDISERARAQEGLRITANALENTAESVMILDRHRRIVSVNKAFTTMTGYCPEEAVGASPAFLRSGEHDPAFYSLIWDTVHQTGRWRGEIWGKRKDGSAYPQWISISQVKDHAGTSSHYVSVSNDVSKYKQYEARLEFLAHHDSLTGLPNRMLFQAHLRDALLRARRRGNLVVLLFIDLDRFKTINDSLGHALGDKLLQTAAQRLKACVRHSDLVARLGGDEFVVVLDELTDSRDGSKIAEKLIDALAEPFRLGCQECFISGSIGISCYPRDGSDADLLLENADAAMYRAKEQGRNTYQFFSTEMNVGAAEQLVIRVTSCPEPSGATAPLS